MAYLFPKPLLTSAGSNGSVPVSDGTTFVPTANVGPTAGVNVGWVTAYDVDLTAQGSQSLSADQNYTINSKTWTKVNSNCDNVAMALTSGVGLVIQPKNGGAASNYDIQAGAQRTCPLLSLPLAQIGTVLTQDFGVRIWVYNSVTNAAANFDNAVFGLDNASGAQATNISYVGVRGYTAASTIGIGCQTYYTSGASGTARQAWFATDALTIGAANNVAVLEIPSLAGTTARLRYGSYSSGWPTEANLITGRTGVGAGLANITGLTPALMQVVLGAMRFNSATAFSTTFARLRVDYLYPLGAAGA